MLPQTCSEALDEDKAIQELSMGHQCLIQLRCLLKGMNWTNDLLQQRADVLSGRALQGFQVGLSFLTSASSKTSGAGSSNPIPNAAGLSDPILNTNFNNKRARSTVTGGTNSALRNLRAKTSASGGTNSTFSNKRAKASASGDINSGDKGKRVCDLDSWTKTADPDHDGHLWAKYVQKPIKGSKHPRNYYKCKHNGCPAVKKVQQCDNTDPPMFYVVYDIEHTCNTAAGIAPLPTPAVTPSPPVQHELRSPVSSAAKDSSPKVSLRDTSSTAKDSNPVEPLRDTSFIAKDSNPETSLWFEDMINFWPSAQPAPDPIESLRDTSFTAKDSNPETSLWFEGMFNCWHSPAQPAPEYRKKMAIPALNFSSASGSCPSLSLNDNSFYGGELNSRPSNSDFSSST